MTDAYDEGMAVRREVLGDAHVDRATAATTPFTHDFQELITRRKAIHSLLVNSRRLAVELRGLATDNQAQIGDALKQLNTALKFLRAREKQIDQTMTNLGPYASILINIIGTGPWFDAYAVNLAAIPTGEFQPGPPDE